jgi:hypothetical protein
LNKHILIIHMKHVILFILPVWNIKCLNFCMLILIDSILEKNVAKGKMSEEERKATRQRIVTTTSLNDLASVDFVIEVSFAYSLSLLQSFILLHSHSHSHSLAYPHDRQFPRIWNWNIRSSQNYQQ